MAAIAPSIPEVVQATGGWLFDLVMFGWDVIVLTPDQADSRPLRILGARPADLDKVLAGPVLGSCLQAIAVRADMCARDSRVHQVVRQALNGGETDVRLWGDLPPDDLEVAVDPVRHTLSTAARAFKAHALAAAALPADSANVAEVFRRGQARRKSLLSMP
jgi:hypothetical protein